MFGLTKRRKTDARSILHYPGFHQKNTTLFRYIIAYNIYIYIQPKYPTLRWCRDSDLKLSHSEDIVLSAVGDVMFGPAGPADWFSGVLFIPTSGSTIGTT